MLLAVDDVEILKPTLLCVGVVVYGEQFEVK